MAKPALINVKEAVKIYYSNIEIGTSEIKQIFSVGSTTAGRLKKAVKEQMAMENKKSMFSGNILTKTAYQVWGLDIGELERMYNKSVALGLEETNE